MVIPQIPTPEENKDTLYEQNICILRKFLLTLQSEYLEQHFDLTYVRNEYGL